MPFRLLRYMVRIWERMLESRDPALERLPALVPVAIYHSDSTWSSSTQFTSILDLDGLEDTEVLDHVVRRDCVLDDISTQSGEIIAARLSSAFVRLVLAVLRDARGSREDGKALLDKLRALLNGVRVSRTSRDPSSSCFGIFEHLPYAWCAAHRVEARANGKLVVATSDAELDALDGLAERARENGVEDLERLDAHDVAAREPDVIARAALWSPSSGIVDAHALMASLLAEARASAAATSRTGTR